MRVALRGLLAGRKLQSGKMRDGRNENSGSQKKDSGQRKLPRFFVCALFLV
jgi:hypothetical protein